MTSFGRHGYYDERKRAEEEEQRIGNNLKNYEFLLNNILVDFLNSSNDVKVLRKNRPTLIRNLIDIVRGTNVTTNCGRTQETDGQSAESTEPISSRLINRTKTTDIEYNNFPMFARTASRCGTGNLGEEIG